MKVTNLKTNLQKCGYKTAAFGAICALIVSNFVPMIRARAIENPENYAEVHMRGATDVVVDSTIATATYEGGTVLVTSDTDLIYHEVQHDWPYPDHQGDMHKLFTESTSLTFTARPDANMRAEALVGGNQVSLTNNTYTYNDLKTCGEGDNEYCEYDIEFVFRSDESGNHPDDPGAPGNTTATFDYTYSGSAGAEWLVNGRYIDVGRYLPEGSHHAQFEDTYNTNPGDTTVTFTFQTLFIDAIDDLTINGHSYNEFLPTGKEALAEHYDGHQHIAFDVAVEKADTYNISTRTHSLSEEEMFMGNFLWDNDTSLLDDPTLPDEARDDIIGHGTLEFVKATYEGATYNTVEELNAAGNLFFFENNNTEGNTDGAMTLPIDAEITLSLIPEPGYQLVSFGINGGEFEPQENIGEYTFTIRGGNGHLAANFEAVDDAVAANADAVESGSIVLGGDEESMNIGTARLDVDDVELSSEEIDGFEDATDGYDISTYLDISLYNTVYKGSETDSWDTEVTELDHEAIITLKLEEGVDGNEVVIVHQKHDGTYEVIPTTYDPVAHTITFKTSSFSNYAIASRTVASPDTGAMTTATKAGATVAIIAEFAVTAALACIALLFVTKRIKY